MQQILYWRMQVLLLCGGHQKVVDVVGSGRWHGAAIEQQALGACVESPQGHVISLSLHGWHLSRNLRAFRARLVVLFSSSELDVRATAHIQHGLWPDPTKVYRRMYLIKMLFTASHGSAAPTGPWRGPHRRAGRAKYLVK